MGVQGWNWLLEKEGFLPERRGKRVSRCSIWRDESAMKSTTFASRVTVIPDGSELHVDGNGLAFALHHVAYARHITQVLEGKRNGKMRNHGNAVGAKSLKKILSTISTRQACRLLPNFMPMHILSEVTREFMSQLKDRHHMKLVVYWDGDARRVFKAATDEKRQEHHPEEWSNLQLYCMNGVFPAVTTSFELESAFPKSRFFITEILETLQKYGVRQVRCDEEADAAIAQAVSGQRNAYIVGEDSDFCFFPSVNYIPLSTLDAGSMDVVTAVVLRRDELAQELDLPDESSMIELAILMGNDYINPKTASLNLFDVEERSASIDFLKNQGTGYRVTSMAEDTEEALSFVRALYELKPLDDFELDDAQNESNMVDDDDDDDDDDELAMDIVADENDNSTKAYRPTVPRSMPVKLLTVDFRVDRSLKDAVIRCLQAYVDMTESREDAMLTQEHLDVFKAMPFPIAETHGSSPKDETVDAAWRPCWSDVPAAYLIEKMIAMSMDQKSLVAHAALPSSIFNQLSFMEKMNEIHESKKKADEPEEEQIFSPPEGEFDMGEHHRLPIDDHEDEILESIARNRVTIIQGETGCGKSSRIPVMLLNAPPPDPKLSQVKMFISQPRRIAAKGLVERVRSVEPELGKVFALRLGHGLREYESDETRAWFCTTGYLVRLVANHPERFNDVSHLIIDEIHDRGVDLDLLCLLCRRLLRVNLHLRLILMSATLAAALYQEYFDVAEPPIQVGARRFPVREVYLEDMLEGNVVSLNQKAQKTVRSIMVSCDKMQAKSSPQRGYVEDLQSLTTNIVASIGKGGTSILVFVPGMNEIISIIEQIGELFIPGLNFTTIPVHSDIPFEDQLAVFSKTKLDECRVIVATNSAESSVTLPALDHVIDLGLQRQIIYNDASHRQLLTLTWISRASATQRAGRTGRIRNGNVYRLFTRECYENQMKKFEPGEMLRIPLDTVILTLKGILPNEESATKVLLECLEPPNGTTIERSLISLHDSRFITSPDDEGEITTLGTFVSSLGTDLSLGALIGLGIQFGVGPEAIQLAGALSFGTKPPWIISNKLLHGAKEFYNVSAETFVSRCHFGSNGFSEPFAIMNLIWDYREAEKKQGWCWKYRVSHQRVQQLSSSCFDLQRRVANLFNIRPEFLDMESPPRSMVPAKLAILRVIQVWVFNDTMIEWTPEKLPKENEANEYVVPLLSKSNQISVEHFDGILKKERHPFEIRLIRTVEQVGLVKPSQEMDDSLSGVLDERLVSYAIEQGLAIVCYRSKKVCIGFVSTQVPLSEVSGVEAILAQRLSYMGTVGGRPVSGKVRGLSERACGRWKLVGIDGNQDGLHSFRFYSSSELGSGKTLKSLDRDLLRAMEVCQAKSIFFRLTLAKGKSQSCSFSMFLNGKDAEAISSRDLKDIFASLDEINPKTSEVIRRQELVFPITDSGPWNPTNAKKNGDSSKWSRPLVQCIPEGAHVLHALASASRRGHYVLLGPVSSDDDGSQKEGEEEEEEEEFLELHLDREQFGSWGKIPQGSVVFLPDLSVPATAIPLNGKSPLQCCCANTLDIRGGSVRVEGLTMLPPGRAFSFFSRLCFGLEPEREDWTPSFASLGVDGGDIPDEDHDDFLQRCLKATNLNERSVELGEELVCDPSFVVDLLDVFDGLQGCEARPWPNLKKNPFTESNLRKGRERSRSVPRATRNNGKSSAQDISSPQVVPATSKPTISNSSNGRSPNRSLLRSESQTSDFARTELNQAAHPAPNRQSSRVSRLATSDAEQVSWPSNMSKLFVTDLEKGQAVGTDVLASPNILALVLKTYMNKTPNFKFQGPNSNWELIRIMDGASEYFQANFQALELCPLVNKEADGTLPEWIKQRWKPTALLDVLDCVPNMFCTDLLTGSFEGKGGVFFQSIETAIRMESAMWLEGQFRVDSKHWFQMSIDDMVGLLQRDAGKKPSGKSKKGRGNRQMKGAPKKGN